MTRKEKELNAEISRLRKTLEDIITMAWECSGLIGKDHPDPDGNKFYRAFSDIGVFTRKALEKK